MGTPIEFGGRDLTLLDSREEIAFWLKEPEDASTPLMHKATTEKVVGTDIQARTITQVISSDRLDRDGDIIDPKGWDFTDWMKSPIVLFSHNYQDLPIARGINVKRRGNEIISTAQFPTADVYPFGDQVFRLASNGYLNSASVGMIPVAAKPIDAEGKVIEDGGDPVVAMLSGSGYLFTKALLLEWSKVPVPSNADALQRAVAKGIADPNILAQGGWEVSREVIDLARYKADEVEEDSTEEILDIPGSSDGSPTTQRADLLQAPDTGDLGAAGDASDEPAVQIASLEAKIADLTSLVAELASTVEEQAEMITSFKPANEPTPVAKPPVQAKVTPSDIAAITHAVVQGINDLL